MEVGPRPANILPQPAAERIVVVAADDLAQVILHPLQAVFQVVEQVAGYSVAGDAGGVAVFIILVAANLKTPLVKPDPFVYQGAWLSLSG
ncbi:MAG: hypothetical protein JXK94_04015 [Deltaproteobacteria bacterium]|nr:hypothetical protein [Deltaproteobacteria bacterium]